MKTAFYNVSDENGKPAFYLVVYDETAPCVFCGLPVVGASVSATAICGWCDNGTPRIPEWQIRRRLNGRPSTKDIWGNKTQDFLFETREECDQKMFDLHGEGIEGYPHVIERMASQAKRQEKQIS